jgi:hypothetical protein
LVFIAVTVPGAKVVVEVDVTVADPKPKALQAIEI